MLKKDDKKMKEKINKRKIYLFLVIIVFSILYSYIKFYGGAVWNVGNVLQNFKLDQLTYIGYEKSGNIVTSIAEDPQIHVSVLGTPTKYVYIDLGVQKVVSSNTSIQVFYDLGGGFSEKQSVKKELREGVNVIELPVAKGVTNLRLDIGNASGNVFVLKKVAVGNKIQFTTGFWAVVLFAMIISYGIWCVWKYREGLMLFYKSHKWEICLVMMAFVTYALWSVILPYNSAPDEYMRYDVPKYIYKFGVLPRGDDPLLCNNVWGVSYAYQPYLAYLVCALFMKIAGAFGAYGLSLLHAARLVSVMCSTMTVIYSIKIAKEVLPERVRKVFVVLVAFMPQFIFISAYVNNDSLALLSTAMIIYYCIRGMKDKWTYGNCVALAISLAICVAAYRNVYGYGFCSAILFVACFVSRYQQEKDKRLIKDMICKGFLIVGIVAIVSGWWFLRNYVIYDGEFWGKSAARAAKLKYAAQGYKPGVKQSLCQQGVSLYHMLFEMKWLAISMKSFVAGFDYMALFIQNWLYHVYYLVLGGGVIGFFVSRKKKVFGKLLGGFIVVAMGIVCFLSVYYSYMSDYQPQGRYLLPAIVPLMMIVSVGFWKLEDYVEGKWSVKVPLVRMIMIFWLISAVFILFTTVIPHYYWIPNQTQELFWNW